MRHLKTTILKSLADNLVGMTCMLGLAAYVLGSAADTSRYGRCSFLELHQPLENRSTGSGTAC